MTKPVEVLYIEDDSGDVDIMKTALRYVDRPNCLSIGVAEDGEAALKYVAEESRHRPDLVLLDLNLPKVHGREVLKAIKATSGWKRIPVIVLTTSSAQKDIEETYDLGAAAYIVKPSNFQDYKKLVKSICDFWIENAALPANPSN